MIVKNISTNRSVVCTLADGTSLRLLPKREVTIKDSQVTDYLKSLSKMAKPIVVLREQKSVIENVVKEEPVEEEKALKKTLKNKEVK